MYNCSAKDVREARDRPDSVPRRRLSERDGVERDDASVPERRLRTRQHVAAPDERGERRTLNLGHTIGHALEVADYLAPALAVDGVLDPSHANPVNCALAAPWYPPRPEKRR